MRCRWTISLDDFGGELGYDFNGNTQMRFTIRNGDSVTGLPGAYDFYGVSQIRQADQDLYSG